MRKLYIIVLLLTSHLTYASDYIQKITMPSNYPIKCFEFSPDGSKILVGSERMTLWDLNSGQLIRTYEEPLVVDGCSFSNDGKYVTAGTEPFNAYIFNAETGEQILKIKTEENYLAFQSGPVHVLGITPDNNFLYTIDYLSFFKKWDIRTGKMAAQIGEGIFRYYDKFLFPDNSSQIITAGDGVRLIDLEQGKVLKEFQGSTRQKLENKRVLLLNGDVLKVFNVKDWIVEETFTIEDTSKLFLRLSMSKDHNALITRGFDEDTRNFSRTVFDLKTGKAIKEYAVSKNNPKGNSDTPDDDIRFFPEGKKFLTVNYNTIYIYDVSNLFSESKVLDQY